MRPTRILFLTGKCVSQGCQIRSYAKIYFAVLSCLQTQWHVEHPFILEHILGGQIKAFAESESEKSSKSCSICNRITMIGKQRLLHHVLPMTLSRLYSHKRDHAKTSPWNLSLANSLIITGILLFRARMTYICSVNTKGFNIFLSFKFRKINYLFRFPNSHLHSWMTTKISTCTARTVLFLQLFYLGLRKANFYSVN